MGKETLFSFTLKKGLKALLRHTRSTAGRRDARQFDDGAPFDVLSLEQCKTIAPTVADGQFTQGADLLGERWRGCPTQLPGQRRVDAQPLGGGRIGGCARVPRVERCGACEPSHLRQDLSRHEIDEPLRC